MLLACSNKTDPVGPQYEDAGAATEMMNVKCPDNLPPFTTGDHGLTVTDPNTQLSARIDSAVAQPPDKSTNNDWTISILDANGQPATNARLNWACAWMAVHGHGSNPRVVTDLGGGKYELKQQNFSMYGPWAVRLWVSANAQGPEYTGMGTGLLSGDVCTPSNGTTGQANLEFDFCVAENRNGS